MSKPDKNDGKRRRSSDGKTPRPSTKTVKMADIETGLSSGTGSGLVDKMTVIAEAVQELQKGQQSLQSMVESKLDKFKNDFLANIDNKFKAMKSDIDLELGLHKKEIDTLAESIKSILTRLESVENRERVQHIERTNPKGVSEEVSSHINRLEETQKDIEKTLIDLQCRSMRDNLLFFGLAEPDGNRKENCVNIVDEFCEDYLGISNISQDIERAHRIGRRRSGEFRPVVVKFSSFRIREKVRSNASRLGGTRFGIQEQFPRQIQEQRKQLYPILKDARKRGKRATLVVNKLYIDGVEYRGPETLDNSIRGTKAGDEDTTCMEG